MASPDTLRLEKMVSLLEKETQFYENKTAAEYLDSLKQYINSVTLTLTYSREPVDYDTAAGIAWVITVPVIYFGSVAFVMALLLVFFKHTDIHKLEATRGDEDEEVDAVNAALRRSSGGGVDLENNVHGHERAVVVDCNGASSTSKGAAFLRGYVNAAGEVEGASRASATSKGSVRSLGVLTNLNDGGVVRPHLHVFQPNPPSAPSALSRHGMTTFELMARRRLSKSIEELRDGARPVVSHGEWSGLGAVGGRTSLEVNVTSGGPQLTLLGSDLAGQETLPGTRRPNSIDSLDNASRDSLRASMELHRESVSGLRPGDKYSRQGRSPKRVAQDGKQTINCFSRGASFSSSSLDTASRSNGGLGNINHSFIDSDIESVNSQSGSNTYSDIVSFSRAHLGKSGENVGFVKSREKGFDNAILTHSNHPPDLIDHLQTPSNAVEGTSSKHSTKTTHTVGSNTAEMDIIDRDTNWSRPQHSNSQFQSQAMSSWSSTSDVAVASGRFFSPAQRGRPLSLDMLTSWSGDMESQVPSATGNAVKKQVPRQLFATTPQMSRKTGKNARLTVDSASQSAPARHAEQYPYNFKLSSLDISPENPSFQNGGRRFRRLADYSSSNSNSNTQESPVRPQEITDPNKGGLRSVTPLHSDQPGISNPQRNGGYIRQTEEKTNGRMRHEPISLSNLQNPPDRHVARRDYLHPSIQESSDTGHGETNHIAASDLSTAASGWTSPESGGPPGTDAEHTGSSANSTIDSISSSLAPFHAKRPDGLELPRTKYHLPNEVDDPRHGLGEEKIPEDNARSDLDESLDPNPGSCNHSLEDVSASHSNSFSKGNTHGPATNLIPSGASTTVRAARPPIAHGPTSRSRHGSLLELARDVFSRPPRGPAIAATSSPRRELDRDLDRSTLSTESASDGVLHNRKVTAEQRLSEFGFIKSTTGKATFVVNPSPGKFSGRVGPKTFEYPRTVRHDQIKSESPNNALKEQEVVDSSNPSRLEKITGLSYIVRKYEMHESTDVSIEQAIVENSVDLNEKISPESSNIYSNSDDFQKENQVSYTTDACQTCSVTEVHTDSNCDIEKSYFCVDGNNNSLDKGPNASQVVIEDLKGVSRPSVKSMKYRFQQREFAV